MGHEGEKLRVYAIDADNWLRAAALLTARAQKQADLSGSPYQEGTIKNQGDPELEKPISQTFTTVSAVGGSSARPFISR